MGPHLYLVISCHIMPSYLLTLLSMLLTAFTLSESAPSPCSHQTSPSTSRWHHLVNSNQRLASPLTGSTHLTNLQDRLAYDTFQRIALGLEVVRTDLEHHEDGSENVNQLWRRVEVQVQEVLVNLLTELEVRGSTSATLTMAALPQSLRCEVHEVVRNQRDFIILRHVLHAASYFTTTLNIH